jgi:hypothetical protein
MGGDIWTSSDSGATWSDRTSAGTQSWTSITSSADGSKLATVDFPSMTGMTLVGGDIWTSSDSGVTWIDRTSAGSRDWYSITSSADGGKLAAVTHGDIWTSSDSGVTWSDQAGAGSRVWQSITSSADGSKLAAVVSGGDIWTSSDSGVTWSDRTSAGSRYWQSITSSADGSKLAAVDYSGDIWTSSDSGVTWIDRTSAGSRVWQSITSSADGSNLAAVTYGGDIWTYAPIPVPIPVSAPIPDPVQRSNITGISASLDKNGIAKVVIICGTFAEKISNIAVNNLNIPPGSWIATATTVSFTLPILSKVTSIQIFNGSAPVLKSQTIIPDPSAIVVRPAPPLKIKVTYLKCLKPSGGLRVIFGVNPVCPVGLKALDVISK